jgi:hypothetical protein
VRPPAAASEQAIRVSRQNLSDNALLVGPGVRPPERTHLRVNESSAIGKVCARTLPHMPAHDRAFGAAE